MNNSSDVLIKRANQIANRHIHHKADASALLYLIVQLGEQQYGLPIAKIKEARPLLRPTPVPKGPPELLGAINNRGAVVSIINLAVLLKEPVLKRNAHAYAIILREDEGAVGFAVDSIVDLKRISASDINSQNDGAAGATSGLVKGYTNNREYLLDIETYFRRGKNEK